MPRCRLIASDTPLSLTLELLTLYSCRLAKTKATVISPDLASGVKIPSTTMTPIRNRKRNAVESFSIKCVEIPRMRSKRKIPVASSPHSLDMDFADDSLGCNHSVTTSIPGIARGLTWPQKKHSELGEYESGLPHIEPPSLIPIYPLLGSAPPELVVPSQSYFVPSCEQIYQGGYDDYYSESSMDEDPSSRLEEMLVRTARSRAQHRERLSKRWESLCSTRIRSLKEKTIQSRILADMAAAAAYSLLAHSSALSTFGASASAHLVMPSDPPTSEADSFSASLTPMSSSSLCTPYGDMVDLTGSTFADHRNELLCRAGPGDTRSLVDRILECMEEFGYEEICVDGLTEAECRRLRTETRKRRRLDRRHSLELGLLLELKQKQMGRSRSSSTSSTSSDFTAEPSTPPSESLQVHTVDHLVAKMLLKRREASHRPCSSSITTRAAFEARGCSSLRNPTKAQTLVARNVNRSYSDTTILYSSDLFLLSNNVLI
ncbi:hypothetical protein CTheo_7790 [Ceratobasidium theobromae]|uniref:Uncharacterized protein n=1 Tax=Ceratobasidium theobromae TaxID=1582974 RepID=A0A5N5QAH0_9AGAM|nr:hypothetical protein CTheo_7790 [Ceratobasidium theobromae]